MDNILCQVVGSKKVVLWEPKEVKHLYVTGKHLPFKEIPVYGTQYFFRLDLYSPDVKEVGKPFFGNYH